MSKLPLRLKDVPYPSACFVIWDLGGFEYEVIKIDEISVCYTEIGSKFSCMGKVLDFGNAATVIDYELI